MEQFSVINAWLILMFRFLFVILDFRSILRSMYKPNEDQKTLTTIRSDASWRLEPLSLFSETMLIFEINVNFRLITVTSRVRGRDDSWKIRVRVRSCSSQHERTPVLALYVFLYYTVHEHVHLWHFWTLAKSFPIHFCTSTKKTFLTL